MTSLRETLIIGTLIAGLFGITGYLNTNDINRCIELGNSPVVCERSFNR